MESNAISLENISKIYKLYNKPTDRLWEALSPFQMKKHRDFYALNNITLHVRKGETVGLIGANGAGKSTLLKIITGIITPSAGSVEVNGKISALLELGAGFNPEYTGIENVYLYGAMMGFSKEEIDRKLALVQDFADIGDFIHQPVKSYSSGMFVRLAFACAVNVEPDLLIIDEALSVGDMRFQQKCYRKIREFKKQGTVLFVSHDLGAILNFCDRVMWFKDGDLYKDGSPEEIIDEYRAFMTYDTTLSGVNASAQPDSVVSHSSTFSNRSQVFGEMGAIIEYARITNEKGDEISVISSGESVNLVIRVTTDADILLPILGFVLKDRLGNSILIINTETENLKLTPLYKNEILEFKWAFQSPMIREGTYSIDLAIAEGTYEQHIQHHWISDALLIDVRNNKSYPFAQGFCILDKIEISQLRKNVSIGG